MISSANRGGVCDTEKDNQINALQKWLQLAYAVVSAYCCYRGADSIPRSGIGRQTLVKANGVSAPPPPKRLVPDAGQAKHNSDETRPNSAHTLSASYI